MFVGVDYNPTPSTTFFISVGLNDKEAISFDFTTKGQRVTKQVLTEKKDAEKQSEGEKPTSEWDVIELKDGKFLNKRHVKWIDKGVIDEVEGEVWKTEWSKEMNDVIKNKLLHYSQFISDHYEDLDSFSDEMKDFNKYMDTLINEYK